LVVAAITAFDRHSENAALSLGATQWQSVSTVFLLALFKTGDYFGSGHLAISSVVLKHPLLNTTFVCERIMTPR